MIGTEGQWLMTFSIGETLTDFIKGEDLTEFTLIENAGGGLPTYELVFQTSNPLVLGYLNEGQIITVSYGKNANDLVDSSLKISKPQINRLGEGGFIVSLVGFEQSTGYLSSPKSQITSAQSGLATIIAVANTYFDVEADVTTSSDSMRWIQPYQPDRTFITQCWLHSDLGDGNTPLIGITSEGAFRVRSLKAMIAQEPVHIFSYEGEGDNIVIEGDYNITLSNGLLNQFAGYGMKQDIYDLNAGTISSAETQVEPLMAFTDVLNRDTTIEPKRLPNGAKNDNVHSRYNEAYNNNIAMLATFSTTKVQLNFTNAFKGVRVLDLVMFKDDALRVTSDTMSSHKSTQDFYTGLYVVSKVSRTVKNGTLATFVELVRESPSEMTGNLR
ncbi:hypothetical protein GR7B_00142 [Vibrio phage vB_VcorM_GR7B]|nr:hypothetical protein GR7B_00142 [Vibrio phage vB_VcorM_GR7B]